MVEAMNGHQYDKVSMAYVTL